MPDFLIRPTGLDAALIDRVLSPAAGRPTSDLIVHPRIVLNADLAARQPAFASSARHCGVPVLVDPQTPYLQDHQHPADRWAALNFATDTTLTPADLSSSRQRELAAAVIAHQIEHGATRLLTPYLHVARVDDGWADRQAGLYRATRATLAANGVQLPLTAVIDLDWRLLDRRAWPDVLDPLLSAARAAGCDEIALAGSRVDLGAHPEQRLADLLAAVRRCARIAPVIAWNQGLFGEICVAAGATGYETGIGWHERSDTTAWMRGRRSAPPAEPKLVRPVYIDKLGRSIPKKTVEHLLAHRGISPDLPCPPGGCCNAGAGALLQDSRMHTIHSRARSLRELATIEAPFRWIHLTARADTGLDLAQRINTVADREGFYKVNTAPLTAIKTMAAAQRRPRRSRAA